MTIDKIFVDKFVNVTSKAAIASYSLVGKKNKIAADKAAVDSMREELNKLSIHGKIVIGEGELDEAPMLYIGEEVGQVNGPEFDIAVDPLEGTNFAANNLPGALKRSSFSAIAITDKAPGRLLAAKLVPSNGSTAISNSGPFLVPSCSPIYNIGASSNSPSPITILPFISILFNSLLIESTAALSAAILSFLPTKYDEAIAAFEVTLIN